MEIRSPDQKHTFFSSFLAFTLMLISKMSSRKRITPSLLTEEKSPRQQVRLSHNSLLDIITSKFVLKMDIPLAIFAAYDSWEPAAGS